MNSVIESSRQTHEEIDLYEQALAAIFLQTDDSVSPSSRALCPLLVELTDRCIRPSLQHKHKLEKEHRASDILNRIVQRKATLKEHYADPSG